MPKLSAKSLKVTVVLNPTEVAGLDASVTPRVTLNISVAELGVVSCDIAAKSLRKALNTISEHGVDRVAVIIQGKLVSGNKVVEAGLVAQQKAPKPVAAEVAA